MQDGLISEFGPTDKLMGSASSELSLYLTDEEVENIEEEASNT